MIFASISFIFVFLPLYLLIDRLLAHYKIPARNFWLLLASLLFYTWGEVSNVLLLIGLGVLDYGGAFLLKQGRKRRNLSLVLLLTLNLGVLFCFKYFAWSGETALGILDYFFPYSFSQKLHIAIPLGISFFCFSCHQLFDGCIPRTHTAGAFGSELSDLLLHVPALGGGSHCALCPCAG